MTLYIHIPFCAKKCFYCSFVVSIGQDQRIDRYIDCLVCEANKFKGTKIDSIYIGGGTPSYLNQQQIIKLFNFIKQYFTFSSTIECTFEINPESIDFDKARLLKDLGVNRVSMGIQSLNDEFLKYLGRNHSRDSAVKAVDILRSSGFININLDLMMSFKDQTVKDLESDVEKISSLDSEHLSIYSLTIEENSQFYSRKVNLPQEELQRQQYVFVIERLAQNGFEQYEVSNFSKPGKESVHNLNYWMAGEYIGLGIGAHSYVNKRRYENISKLTEYINCIENNLTVVKEQEILNIETQFKERLVFGLRMNKGIDVSILEKDCNYRMDLNTKELIDDMVKEKLLIREESLFRTTLQGRLLLDEISARLI